LYMRDKKPDPNAVPPVVLSEVQGK
jgi:hypothetical protein